MIGGYQCCGWFSGKIQHVHFSNQVRTSFPYGSYALITSKPSTAAGDQIGYQFGPRSDLVMQAVSAYPNSGAQGGVIVQAILINEGEGSTQNGFTVDLHADHVPVGPGDFEGSVKHWQASPIEPGTVITITSIITDTSAMVGQTRAGLEAGIEEITTTLYTHVDSTGVVSETDESNNISAGTEVCLASADAYEGDDNYDVATLITTDGMSQTHNIHRPSDQDWLEFQAEEGITYTIQTSNLGLGADTYLYLYDTDGTTLLAANDDHAGTLASQITWQVPVSGTYYIMVTHWNPNMGGCGTRYDIHISDAIGLPGDVNHDGSRNAIDGLFILQFEVGLRNGSDLWPPPPGTLYLPLCDVSGDGDCTSLDAFYILQCEAGIANPLCPAVGSALSPTQEQDDLRGNSFWSAHPTATLSIGSGIVRSGESITTALTAALGAESLGAITARIQYDPAVLDAVNCSADPHSAFDMTVCNTDFDVDEVLFTAISTVGVSQDAALAKIAFQAVGQLGQSSLLNLAATVFADPDGDPIPFNVENGQIHIAVPALYLPMISRDGGG